MTYRPDTCPNDGAYPLAAEHGMQEGLTKRELFAAMAMQGMALRCRELLDHEVASASVRLADELIAALSKEPKP